LAQAYNRPVHLMHRSRGCYDAMPVSLISVASLEGMGAQVGRDLDARRFRPNVLIETVDPTPFSEDRWLDHVAQIGDGPDAPLLRISRQNVRCAMPNIDPDTGERDARVL